MIAAASAIGREGGNPSMSQLGQRASWIPVEPVQLAELVAARSTSATSSSNRSRLIWSPARVRCSARNAAPVERRQAQPPDRVAVLPRRVALVALPAVAGVAGGERDIIRSRTTLATTEAQAIV